MDYKPQKFIPDDFSFSENENWFHIHGAPLCQQAGWKLYIPFTNEFAENSLTKVLPFLAKKSVNFKYIKSPTTLEKLNSGECGYSQIGKCIVIYQPEVEKNFVLELIETLRDAIGSYPRPPYLARLCENPPIFYRYGDYINCRKSSKSVWNERATVERRTLFSSDEFDQNKKEAVSALNKLLLQYPVVDVISQQGKGGVFVAVDIREQDYKEVIVKLGYKHGNENASGADGIMLIKNEESMLNYLTSKNQPVRIPRILASAHGNDAYAIVQEKMEGENSRAALQRGSISVAAIQAMIDGIRHLHKAGIVWCDAKIDNIIIDSNYEKISFVDFETAIISGWQKIHSMRTFQSKEYEMHAISAEELDVVHFLVSVLFDTLTDDQRNIEMSRLACRSYTTPVQLYCARLLQGYLQ